MRIKRLQFFLSLACIIAFLLCNSIVPKFNTVKALDPCALTVWTPAVPNASSMDMYECLCNNIAVGIIQDCYDDDVIWSCNYTVCGGDGAQWGILPEGPSN